MLKMIDNTTKIDDVPTTTIPVPMMCCLMLFILFPVVVVLVETPEGIPDVVLLLSDVLFHE